MAKANANQEIPIIIGDLNAKVGKAQNSEIVIMDLRKKNGEKIAPLEQSKEPVNNQHLI